VAEFEKDQFDFKKPADAEKIELLPVEKVAYK